MVNFTKMVQCTKANGTINREIISSTIINAHRWILEVTSITISNRWLILEITSITTNNNNSYQLILEITSITISNSLLIMAATNSKSHQILEIINRTITRNRLILETTIKQNRLILAITSLTMPTTWERMFHWKRKMSSVSDNFDCFSHSCFWNWNRSPMPPDPHKCFMTLANAPRYTPKPHDHSGCSQTHTIASWPLSVLPDPSRHPYATWQM